MKVFYPSYHSTRSFIFFITLSTAFMSIFKVRAQIILPYSRCGRTMEVYKRGTVVSFNVVNELYYRTQDVGAPWKYTSGVQ